MSLNNRNIRICGQTPKGDISPSPLSPIPVDNMDVEEFIRECQSSIYAPIIHEQKFNFPQKNRRNIPLPEEERPRKIVKITRRSPSPIQERNRDPSRRNNDKLNSYDCPFLTKCSFGLNCKKDHTAKERHIFYLQQKFPTESIKTRLCRFYYTGANCDPKRCIYAHGLHDMVCEVCYGYGHSMDICSKRQN